MSLRIIALTLGVFCVLVSLALSQKRQNKRVKGGPCQSELSQMELNQCYCNEYRKANAELNKMYQQVLSANAGEPQVPEKLKAAQRAWLAFRDAQLEAIYPTTGSDPREQYGSIYPMCYCMEQTKLTVQRTQQLNQMLNSTEGDVCP